MKPQHSFAKNALGVKINENSATHMNQYLKMFSVDMSSVQYKTDQVLFRVTSVQGPSIDEIYNLTIYKNSNSLGITIVELEQVKSFESDNSANLIAVLESTNTVSVYLKMTNTTIITALKILSFQKYGPEKLTISSEQYVDSLPSGTQYQAFSDDQVIQEQYSFKGLTFSVIKYKRIVEISINGSTDQSLGVNTFYDLQLDDIFKPLQQVNDNITLSTTEAGMIRITTTGLFRIYPWTNLASDKGFRYTVTYISAY